MSSSIGQEEKVNPSSDGPNFKYWASNYAGRSSKGNDQPPSDSFSETSHRSEASFDWEAYRHSKQEGGK
jgi:hypothetical protein